MLLGHHLTTMDTSMNSGELLAPFSDSFPHSACGRKESGNIGEFKPLTSGGSDRVPPIRLQNEITWVCDSLKAQQKEVTHPKTNKELLDC